MDDPLASIREPEFAQTIEEIRARRNRNYNQSDIQVIETEIKKNKDALITLQHDLFLANEAEKAYLRGRYQNLPIYRRVIYWIVWLVTLPLFWVLVLLGVYLVTPSETVIVYANQVLSYMNASVTLKKITECNASVAKEETILCSWPGWTC
jgi:hypothetical protein